MSPRPREAADPTLPVPVARTLAFVPLAGFAGLQWMALLDPHVPGRAGLALLIAIGTIGAMLAAARLPGRARYAVALLITLAALLLSLLAGGVPGRFLHLSHWDELAAGINRGIAALPGVRLPYKGLDPWIRLVMPLGGIALIVLAAAIAFWPRRGRLGWPLPALILLVILYAVPTVTLALGAEVLSGGVFSVFVLAFLRLERLRVRDARFAAVLAGMAVIVGMAATPLIDEDTPWFDYEAWALEASASKTTTYSWNHSYGPLRWPRDGREMLRVRARRPAYWKAENLVNFDGMHWINDDTDAAPQPSVPDDPQTLRRWTELIHVSIQNLRSPQFITGGYTFDVRMPGDLPRRQEDGTYTNDRTLERGDAYTAAVYSPQPSERERHAAPALDDAPVWADLRLSLPVASPDGGMLSPTHLITFPRWGTGGTPRVMADVASEGSSRLAREVLHTGPYAGVWNLVQRLKRGASDQEDYVGRILRYLAGPQFSYTESPPRSAETLAGFLLDAKSGYCQQYSGAMALLLRMGGVPARVATGFTSGALDEKAKEYVVRDLDAHSWVEVWYAGIGWVTFDPTPASAPPRAQPDEVTTNLSSTQNLRAPLLPGDKAGTRASMPAPAQVEPAPWWRVPLIIVAALLALATGAWAWRRARRGTVDALVELQRALRRTRIAGTPGMTLTALENRFGYTPAAADYVRTLRDARYGGRPGRPTSAQRRALRAELARGRGLGGRLRAWWALPPL